MRPQGIDDLGALAYQHIARAMLHQLTLLLADLIDEAHGRSPNRELARIGQLVPDDFYSRSSVGETGVDHFDGAREQASGAGGTASQHPDPMKTLSVSLDRLDQMLRVRIRQNFRIQAGQCGFERLPVDFCDSHA